ncbi:hypothetical protein ACOP1M_00295 [Staphylococcus warneri]|uniref:hypothetical protein n=1 Tax=Staphylococcus warneri TaxID=1292 RepID=UPI003CF3AD57
MIETKEVYDYLNKIPTPQSYSDLPQEKVEKYIFNAQEEINDVLISYPTVKITPRMIAVQTLYNLEGEEEGIAMMRRQGITDYTVKDVKAVLDKDTLSPNVFAMIKALAEQDANPNLRVGRLI